MHFTKKELQERWKVSQPTLDRILKRHAHVLKAFKVGALVRVPAEHVERFEREQLAHKPAKGLD